MAVAAAYPSLPGLLPRQIKPHDLRIVQLNTLFKNPKPQAAVHWISTESPDIVLLQEVSPNTQQIADSLTGSYPYQIVCEYGLVGGVAVLSRFRFTASKCIQYEGLVWAQADVNGRELSFASVHLYWPYPYRQWKQIDGLIEELRNIPRPVVVAGDFNAAPWSEAVHKIERATGTQVVPGLRLSFSLGFNGVASPPVLPLDHILLPPELEEISVRLGPSVGSDHLPAIANVAYARE